MSHLPSTHNGCWLKNYKQVDSLIQNIYTYKLLDLWIFAKYFDRLADDRLIKIIFRVDGVTPEAERCDTYSRDGKIGETSKGPV